MYELVSFLDRSKEPLQTSLLPCALLLTACFDFDGFLMVPHYKNAHIQTSLLLVLCSWQRVLILTCSSWFLTTKMPTYYDKYSWIPTKLLQHPSKPFHSLSPTKTKRTCAVHLPLLIINVTSIWCKSFADSCEVRVVQVQVPKEVAKLPEGNGVFDLSGAHTHVLPTDSLGQKEAQKNKSTTP